LTSGYDGTGDNDLGDILKGRYPDNMGPTDVGCCTSHLKAIEYWYNNFFAIRGGYFIENKTKGGNKYVTTGLGFKINNYN
jgi:hypothetical protein